MKAFSFVNVRTLPLNTQSLPFFPVNGEMFLFQERVFMAVPRAFIELLTWSGFFQHTEMWQSIRKYPPFPHYTET